MDLKTYFKKIREIEATIPEPFVVIASLQTSEGGKEGTCTEVAKCLAARMIAEGRGRLATEQESASFRLAREEAKQAAEALAAAQRMQFTVVQPLDGKSRVTRGLKD